MEKWEQKKYVPRLKYIDVCGNEVTEGCLAALTMVYPFLCPLLNFFYPSKSSAPRTASERHD
jgi:hypothetical protein